MTTEVCMFDKFGFCKWEANCKKVHLREKCLLEDCEKRKCQKRHPRQCKFFSEKGFCKFNDNCKFDHRPPKLIRDLVSRLEAVEKQNEKLLKVIEEQGKQIVAMGRENVVDEIKNLQQQVGQLKLANKMKSAQIVEIDEINKKIQHERESLMEDKDEEDEEETLVELVELPCEHFNKNFRIKLVEQVKNLEEEVNKLRKGSTLQIKSKINLFNKMMKKEKGNRRLEYALECCLETFNDLGKKKTDKEELMEKTQACIYSHDY